MATPTRILLTLPLLCSGMLAITACGERSSTPQQASNTMAPPPSAAPSPPPPAPPPPDPEEQVAKALDSLGAEQTERGRAVRLSSAEFGPGDTNFEPKDTQRLEAIVTVLRDHPEMHLMIEGYTDNRGSESVNRKIAEQRAAAVRQALVDRGVDQARLRAVGVGEEHPIADNSTDEGRQQNRRVELIFSDTEGRFASSGSTPPTG